MPAPTMPTGPTRYARYFGGGGAFRSAAFSCLHKFPDLHGRGGRTVGRILRHLADEADSNPIRHVSGWATGARPEYLKPVPSAAAIIAVTAGVTPIIVWRFSPCFFREVTITGAPS